MVTTETKCVEEGPWGQTQERGEDQSLMERQPVHTMAYKDKPTKWSEKTTAREAGEKPKYYVKLRD